MRFFALILGLVCCFDAFAATPTRTSKLTQSNRAMPQSARMATATSTSSYNNINNTVTNSISTQTTSTVSPEEAAEIAQKEKERQICVGNNIGINNTFVWAARNSNTNSYTYMVEDSDDIRNNTCFVKVQIASTDSNVDVSDIPSKYFEMGRSITCGSWIDESNLEKRILDAKKTGRVLGTVAASVGGTAVGVGAMELFGNKLIGGKVEGQKSLSQKELLRSQVLVLKNSNNSEYERVIHALDELEKACGDEKLWNGANKPSDCDAEANPFMGLRDLL